MATADLMGGYAAYATPNAIVQEMATSGVSQDGNFSFSISVVLSLPWSISIVTPTMSFTEAE